MTRRSNIQGIRDLSEEEGVFTTAQAGRFGISRNALSYAANSGTLERLAQGAYRLSGTRRGQYDELVAVWKLTAPERMTYERMVAQNWDGITVGGRTAAVIRGLGDFDDAPYVIYSPTRINSRREGVRFVMRRVSRQDVSFEFGMPVTQPPRTMVDLLLDGEEPSLVEDAYRDASRFDFDRARFVVLLHDEFNHDVASSILMRLDGGLQ